MSGTDLGTRALKQFINCNLAKSVFAINAGGAATVKTTNGLLYSNGGILVSAAALAARALTLPPADSEFTPIPFYALPANSTGYILFVGNGAGTVYAIQSQHLGRDMTFMGQVNKGDGQCPEAPEGYTPLAAIKAVTNGATTFLPGTDALDKAGVTFTFYDLQIVPAGNF